MNFSPERQPNNEPKAEDNYKSRTMNFQPGTTDEQRTKADVYSFSQRRSKPNVVRSPNSVSTENEKVKYFNRCPELFDNILLLCNGKSYNEISQALADVKNVEPDKSILDYSVNRYTPQQKLRE